jgi:maltose/maltodextrin transport system substrate-binding protein
MKRGIALALAAAFALPAAAQDAPRLLVWINGDKGYNGLQKVGDAFAQKSGVKVVVQHPEAAPEKFQQAVGAGKGPDIFCWPHDRVGEWAKSGLIVPVQPSRRVRAEIDDSAWRAFLYKGKTWGYPIAIEAIGLIYNKALVPVPPKTFAEVVKLDAELKKQGRHALLWHYNKAFFSWPMFAGAGGYVFGRKPNGDYDPLDIGVNQPGAVKAGETLAALVKNGQMNRFATYSDMENGFARGEVAMMISGPWAWDNVRRSKIDFGVAAIPSVTGAPSKSFVGVLGCMISAPSRNKDIAREFLENHLLRPEYLKMVSSDVPLGTPANKAYYAELSQDPAIRATMENVRNGEPVPNIPEVQRFWTAVDAALEAITNGLQSPQEALDAARVRMLVK